MLTYLNRHGATVHGGDEMSIEQPKRRWLGLCLAASLFLWSSVFAPLASAQGVTVITGQITLDGNAAGGGNLVQVTLQDGTVIGQAFTGVMGFADNEYRVDIQSTASLQGEIVFVQVVINGTPKPETNPPSAFFFAGQLLTVHVSASSIPGSVGTADALAAMIGTGFLEIVTSFNYGTRLYESFVPNLSGDSLTIIRPSSVLVITTTQDLAIVVSDIPFTIGAGIPTPVPVGTTVSIALG